MNTTETKQKWTPEISALLRIYLKSSATLLINPKFAFQTLDAINEIAERILREAGAL